MNVISNLESLVPEIFSVVSSLLQTQAAVGSVAVFVKSSVILLFDISFFQIYFTNIFVILIWIFFVFACISIWRYRKYLLENEVNLKQIEKNADNLIKNNQDTAKITKTDLLININSGSLVAERIKDLELMFRHGGNSETALLADNLTAREFSKLSFVRYVASILVLLGLCGAIYGLSGIVLKMGPELRNVQELTRQISDNQTNDKGQNTSLVAVQNSIGTLVDGMAGSLEDTQGAFAASLTGVIFSVILLFFNWWIGKKQSIFLSDFESLTLKYLTPLFQPATATAQLTEAAKSLNYGSGHAANLAFRLDELVIRTNESLEKIFAIIRKFEDSAKVFERSNLSVTEAQDKMLELAQQFTSLTSLVEKHQEISREEITNVISSVNVNSESITKVLTEWRQKHEEGLQIMEKTFKYSEEKQSTLQESSVNEIVQFRAQMLESIDKIQKHGQDQIKLMLAEQKKYIDNLSETFTKGKGYKELVTHLDKIFKDEREDFSKNIREIIELQGKNIVSEREAMIKHLTELADKSKDSADSVHKSSTELSIDYEPFRKANSRILETQKEINKKTEKLTEHSEKMTRSVAIATSGFALFLVFAGLEKAGTVFGLFTELSAISFTVVFLLSVIISGGLFFLLNNED